MVEYFEDVHPSLIEAFMYQGSLFQLPLDFNAANVYYNTAALQAGLQRPPMTGPRTTFSTSCAPCGRHADDFRPYFWTNRLWGGVVPWLYINDTSFLDESKSTGGDWFWDHFYPTTRVRAARRRLPVARAQRRRSARRGVVRVPARMVGEGLGSSPAQGGGDELVARFAEGLIGMTPAGGFWVYGLNQGGMARASST